MSGYARIHRSLLGHAAFRNDAEAMAFAWMVIRAAWKPCRVRYKGHTITLGRGQLAVSQRDMAAALDRDKAWVERLWRRLKSEAMIETCSEAGVAVITICNYGEYQHTGQEREASREALGEADNEAGARQARGTEQRREEYKKDSVPNGTGGEGPPIDPEKEFWTNAKAYLKPHVKGDPGALVGQWLRDEGKELTTAAINAAQLERAVNPIEYCQGYFRRHRGPARPAPSGSDDATRNYLMEEIRQEREWNERKRAVSR